MSGRRRPGRGASSTPDRSARLNRDAPVALIAEDDVSVRLTLEVLLSDAGFDVVTCNDGSAALEAALADVPDVIVLDQMMPKMNGDQVLAALQDDPSTRDVPVFLLTGMAEAGSEESSGVTIVGKPFEPDELVRLLQDAVGAV